MLKNIKNLKEGCEIFVIIAVGFVNFKQLPSFPLQAPW